MSNKTINTFVKRLNHLLIRDGQGGKLYERANFLAATFGVTPQAARKWLQKETLPQIDTIKEIADHFHVSLDYLFGRQAMETTAGVFDSDSVVIDSPGNYFGTILAGDKLIVRPLRDRAVDVDAYYLVEFMGIRQIMQFATSDAGMVATVEDDAGKRRFEITPAPAVEHLLANTIGEVLGVIRNM